MNIEDKHQPKPIFKVADNKKPAEPSQDNISEPTHKKPIDKTITGILIPAIGLGLIIFFIFILMTPQPEPITPITDPDPTPEPAEVATIEFEDFTKETEAYEINYQLPTGSTEIENLAKADIENIVEDFIATNTKDRESAVAEFGELPSFLKRPVFLEIKASAISSTEPSDYQTIYYSIYEYTGGANGNSRYQVITLRDDEQIENLGDVVSIQDRAETKEFIVSELGSTDFNGEKGSQILSPVSLRDLSLDNVRFGVDNGNVILFFDEYQVGPGVLGSFTIEIPASELNI